jgi:energy-coupling factor transporter transmembrane protein EcfT
MGPIQMKILHDISGEVLFVLPEFGCFLLFILLFRVPLPPSICLLLIQIRLLPFWIPLRRLLRLLPPLILFTFFFQFFSIFFSELLSFFFSNSFSSASTSSSPSSFYSSSSSCMFCCSNSASSGIWISDGKYSAQHFTIMHIHRTGLKISRSSTSRQIAKWIKRRSSCTESSHCIMGPSRSRIWKKQCRCQELD